MGLKNYKNNEVIEVVYQANGAASGIECTMDVYDEAGVKVAAMSGVMAEIGNQGRYKKSFTPDAEGTWIVLTSDANGGKSAASYSVGAYNVDTLGIMVAASDDKVTSMAGGLGAMDVKVTAVDEKITTVDGKTDVIGGKIDSISARVDIMVAPPMIG